jgi:hypothetical protein
MLTRVQGGVVHCAEGLYLPKPFAQANPCGAVVARRSYMGTRFGGLVWTAMRMSWVRPPPGIFFCFFLKHLLFWPMRTKKMSARFKEREREKVGHPEVACLRDIQTPGQLRNRPKSFRSPVIRSVNTAQESRLNVQPYSLLERAMYSSAAERGGSAHPFRHTCMY